jgi:predicted CoA-binding protein
VASKAVVPLITGGVRGQPARVELSRLVKLLDAFMRFAERHVPRDVVEFEINPLVLGSEGPVALDALIKIGPGHEPQTPSRPLDKLEHLLHPRSVAVIGVSEKLNPGRIIVANLIREGFGRDNIHIVKAGQAEIDGCRCYADVASLPERMDLIILSIDAAQVPASVEQIIDQRKAEALIIIPGGLGERKGSETLVHELEGALRRSRESDWRGPLINGGNCLGVRSVPGRYDTLFIPTHKLPLPRGEAAPLAVISQSGAFSVSKASKLGRINPKYLISLGNQVDLTVGDYLSYLKDDPELELFACYVEGFRPGDGGRWLDAAAEITGRGGTVILYRAGRTAEGADASASHTASVAGDYVVARELARAAGVIVAETLADFEDLVRLFALLRGKQCRRRQSRPLPLASVRRGNHGEDRQAARALSAESHRRHPQPAGRQSDNGRRTVRGGRALRARGREHRRRHHRLCPADGGAEHARGLGAPRRGPEQIAVGGQPAGRPARGISQGVGRRRRRRRAVRPDGA